MSTPNDSRRRRVEPPTPRGSAPSPGMLSGATLRKRLDWLVKFWATYRRQPSPWEWRLVDQEAT